MGVAAAHSDISSFPCVSGTKLPLPTTFEGPAHADGEWIIMSEMPSEEALFAEVRRLSTPAARRAFLEQACAGDAALRQRVESLLRAIGESPETTVESTGTLVVPVIERP